MTRNLWLGLMIASSAVGCYQPQRDLRMLGDREPSMRALAVSRLGAHGIREAVPALIERLSDEDAIVRGFAVRSLREMTGQRFGYDPNASPDARRAAVREWTRWWERRQQAGPVDGP